MSNTIIPDEESCNADTGIEKNNSADIKENRQVIFLKNRCTDKINFFMKLVITHDKCIINRFHLMMSVVNCITNRFCKCRVQTFHQ